VSMPERITLALVALLGSSELLAAPPVAGKESLFCCGRVCGDSLPEACRGQTYKVFDGKGNLLRVVGPPLTPEQKAAKAAEEERQKVLEAQRLEQRRKDQALLQTYTSMEDIDRAQARAEVEVATALKGAEAKIAEAKKKRQKLDSEMEFYKKSTPPAELQKALRENEHEIKTQQELLDVKKKDFESITAKYDQDRQRFIQLTGSRPKN
jgi:hypothetical protein